MGRMNGHKRKRIYEYLVHRDGEICFIGGEPGNSETLVVDHWGNDGIDDPENLHLICRSMNHIKNPRGRDHRHKLHSSVYVCVSANVEKLEPVRSNSAEFVKNQTSEPAFKHWLFREIANKRKVLFDEVIDCGAAVANCSQETIKRYVRKETSRVRLYHIIEEAETGKKYITLRPEWDSFRKVNEEREKLDECVKNWRNF